MFVIGLLGIVGSLRPQIDEVHMCNSVLHFKTVSSWVQNSKDFEITLQLNKL